MHFEAGGPLEDGEIKLKPKHGRAKVLKAEAGCLQILLGCTSKFRRN